MCLGIVLQSITFFTSRYGLGAAAIYNGPMGIKYLNPALLIDQYEISN